MHKLAKIAVTSLVALTTAQMVASPANATIVSPDLTVDLGTITPNDPTASATYDITHYGPGNWLSLPTSYQGTATTFLSGGTYATQNINTPNNATDFNFTFTSNQNATLTSVSNAAFGHFTAVELYAANTNTFLESYSFANGVNNATLDPIFITAGTPYRLNLQGVDASWAGGSSFTGSLFAKAAAVSTVPVPGSLGLFTAGLAALAVRMRKSKGTSLTPR